MATFEEFTSQFGNTDRMNDPSSVFSRFLDANPQATFFGTLPENMTQVQRQASGDVYNQAIQESNAKIKRYG